MNHPDRFAGTLGSSTGGLRSMGPGNYWPSNDGGSQRPGANGWKWLKDHLNMAFCQIWSWKYQTIRIVCSQFAWRLFLQAFGMQKSHTHTQFPTWLFWSGSPLCSKPLLCLATTAASSDSAEVCSVHGGAERDRDLDCDFFSSWFCIFQSTMTIHDSDTQWYNSSRLRNMQWYS